uniref:F-box protein At3g26010-like beta-propeller domain-containing protein n=1 Tax=Oryza nivara TaxID=4536 RepID=A0A0E0I1N7_ORYNI
MVFCTLSRLLMRLWRLTWRGKKWRKIPVPDRDNDIGIIHQTQGCLCAFNTIKHTVSSLDLFEGKNYRLDFEYQVIAVHPECNLIFFVYGLDNTLMAYEMDRKEVCRPGVPSDELHGSAEAERQVTRAAASLPCLDRLTTSSPPPTPDGGEPPQQAAQPCCQSHRRAHRRGPPPPPHPLRVPVQVREQVLAQTLVCPTFSFLPQCHDVVILDCCNGLLLCRCYVSRGTSQFHYAVCNPATKEWVMLRDANWAVDERRTARLCFDPAISSHFHVLEYVEDEDSYVTGVEIYSSETGLWTLHENGWNDEEVSLDVDRTSVFLNGFLHSVTYAAKIVVVDMEGKKWRRIPMPDPDGLDNGIIHQTQGRLCAFHVDPNDIFKLSIWFLEDYDTDNWILKHTMSSMKLFGGKKYRLDSSYQVIAVHPECNLIFFVYGWHNTLMAYEMDRKEVRAIRKLGHESRQPYLPYVPMFSESLADGR